MFKVKAGWVLNGLASGGSSNLVNKREISSPEKGARELAGLLQPLPKAPANEGRISETFHTISQQHHFGDYSNPWRTNGNNPMIAAMMMRQRHKKAMSLNSNETDKCTTLTW